MESHFSLFYFFQMRMKNENLLTSIKEHSVFVLRFSHISNNAEWHRECVQTDIDFAQWNRQNPHKIDTIYVFSFLIFMYFRFSFFIFEARFVWSIRIHLCDFVHLHLFNIHWAHGFLHSSLNSIETTETGCTVCSRRCFSSLQLNSKPIDLRFLHFIWFFVCANWEYNMRVVGCVCFE